MDNKGLCSHRTNYPALLVSSAQAWRLLNLTLSLTALDKLELENLPAYVPGHLCGGDALHVICTGDWVGGGLGMWNAAWG